MSPERGEVNVSKPGFEPASSASVSPAAGGRFSAGRARACAAVGPRRHGGARGGARRRAVRRGAGGAGPRVASPRSFPPGRPQEPPAEPQLRDTPDDICLEAAANAIALHPARELLAAGDVDGDVYL